MRCKVMPSVGQWIAGGLTALVSFLYACPGLRFQRIDTFSIVLYALLIPFALMWAGHHCPKSNKRQKGIAALTAFLFAQFITIGRNYFTFYHWDYCLNHPSSWVVWALQSLVYGYVIYRIVLALLATHYSDSQPSDAKPFPARRWLCLILGVKGIWLLLCFPCLFDFDAALGLYTYFDVDSATCNHNPVFVQFVHALSFSLGQAMDSPSAGFLLLSLLSILGSSLIVVYGLQLLHRGGLSPRWLRGVGLTVALFPLFPIVSLLVTKDGFFCYAFLLYLFTLYEVLLTRGDCLLQLRFMLLHGSAILLVCLTRNQGIYFVFFEFLLLLLLYRRLWHKVLLSSLPGLTLAVLYYHLLLPALSVEPGGKQEMYGMLFQQSAYCLVQHPQDITEAERASIDAILNADSITHKYNPGITDPVKNDYKYNPLYILTPDQPRMFRHVDYTHEGADLRNYLSTWASMGLRHPGEYMRASAAIFLGFFYNSGRGLINIYSRGADRAQATTDEYRFWRITSVIEWFNDFSRSCARLPLLSWIFAIPYFNWTAILLLMMLLYRRDYRGLVLFCPVLLSLGLLLICPVVNGRYLFPIVASLPFMLAYLLTPAQTQNDDLQTKQH